LAGQGGHHQNREETALIQARELIVFADGAEEAGMISYARRARVVARDLIRLAGELETERSARQKIQADRDRCLQILGNHAAEAL
jgi:hypothetical protein